MTKFAQCQSEACFRMAHFSEQHEIPIGKKFWDGTSFGMAHVSEWQATGVFNCCTIKTPMKKTTI